MFSLITSVQICGARALLDWPSQVLSEHSAIGISASMRLEASVGIPSGNIKTFEAVQKTFEQDGIKFIGTLADRLGVQLKNPVP